MDRISKATQLAPIITSDRNANGNECDNVWGPLSPSFPPYSATSHRRFSIPDFSGGSFTSEDLKRSPLEAANMEFRSVGPDQISMVKVLSKQEYTNRSSRVNKERAESLKEDAKELEPLEEPEGDDGGIPGIGVCRKPGAEIHVNGEAYALHADGVFRPKILNMSIKEQFKGYAVHANGLFKPLGGSPAAIDAGTLYRVTPTNRYSLTNQEHDSRALHRIKSVEQLLMRGTSGHEEYMYAYDPHWGGFVQTEEKRRFPPEKAMLKPGNLRSSIHTQNSEELFASAEDSLQKTDRDDFTKKEKRPSHKILRSLALTPDIPPNPRVTEPTLPQIPQTPALLTKLIKIDEQLQGSWLNIDLPLPQRDSPTPHTSHQSTGDPDVHPLSPIFDVVSDPTPSNGSNTQCTPIITAFHKPIHRILGVEVPQRTGVHTAATLQQLINECVLVLCLYSSQSSRYPKIARMKLPNNVSADFGDMDMFLKMGEEYNKLRGFWRRLLSLRGLKRIDIVECHRTERHTYPTSFRADNFSPEKLFECYLNPHEVSGDRNWVEWAHRLSIDEDRYALEFVEGWKPGKIMVAGVVPITLSIAGGLLWGMYGPGQEYLVALALGIFVIILGWSIIGLLVVLSYSL